MSDSKPSTASVQSGISTATSGAMRTAQVSLCSYSIQHYARDYRHEEAFYLGNSSPRKHGALLSHLDSTLRQWEGTGTQRQQ
ncbi:hypothetical protein GJ744_005312 [Endocarpon pusillum]|uniref:Uncharacterized protein n=1 Tax=Endocarpon pusillum TaxID=364733 RepID=A0A8H7AQ02_9EURO|nr:hypothetical protein GJ744_005312 [Endocarpon pusillum]